MMYDHDVERSIKHLCHVVGESEGHLNDKSREDIALTCRWVASKSKEKELMWKRHFFRETNKKLEYQLNEAKYYMRQKAPPEYREAYDHLLEIMDQIEKEFTIR